MLSPRYLPLTIIATMIAIGGGAGSLFRMSKTRGERFHPISQVITDVVVPGFVLDFLADFAPGVSGNRPPLALFVDALGTCQSPP